MANPLPWLQPAPPVRLIPPSHLIIILSALNEGFSSPSPTQALADYCNPFDSQGILQEGGEKDPEPLSSFRKLGFLSCKLEVRGLTDIWGGGVKVPRNLKRHCFLATNEPTQLGLNPASSTSVFLSLGFL